MISELISKYGLLNVQKQDLGGSTGSLFYQADLPRYEKVIVKLALTERAKKEIAMNNHIYKTMQQIGLTENNPCLFQGDDYSILLDLRGKDLIELINNNPVPEKIYSFLCVNLKEIYLKTLIKDKETGLHSFDLIFGDSTQGRYFRDYLLPKGLIEKEDLNKLKSLQEKKDQLILEHLTFSAGGELQPEHLFINDSNLLYLDPREPNFTSPIIELSILAELLDTYGLSDAHIGYEKIKNLISDLGDVFNLSSRELLHLENLGKIRQGTLTARFRADKDRDVAELNAQKAVRSIEEILETLQ
jgi:hypothetical protein